MEKEPHGLFKFLWDSMELSIAEIDKGVKMVGPLPVRLTCIRPDTVSSEDEEEVGLPEIHIADSDGDLPLLAGLRSNAKTFLRSPTSILKGSEDSRDLPGDYTLPSSDIPPDEFGDMVHSILQGMPAERVLGEYGWSGRRSEVMEEVDAIRTQLKDLDIESSHHEVEVAGTLRDEKGEDIPVIGRMDLLARMKDGSFLIVDYKTGKPREEHDKQLGIYRDLLKVSFGGEIETLVIYSKGKREGCSSSIDEP
jgi:hypothetical protein